MAGAEDSQPILVARNDRRQWAVVLAGSLAMSATGARWGLFDPGREPYVGLGGMLFFGCVALVAFIRLIDSAPRVVIDRRGVYDRTLGLGVIGWDRILRADLYEVSGNAFIGLQLRDEDALVAALPRAGQRLARRNRDLEFPTFSVNLAATDLDPRLALEVIAKMAARHSRL